MLSVIIPARNEIYLEKTIRSILAAAEGEIEILAMLDGYKPDPQIEMNDNRVKFEYYPESIGQRQCINAGAKIAKGEFIMKLDAHCNVDKGFDVKLAADCEHDWTVIPRMYNLDHETWQPKLHKRTDYMYIGCGEGRLLRAEYYDRQPDTAKLIDDTMCCMGPGWFMRKDRFWELGGMDENHGSWGQMGVEVALKAWLSGGALKVNKKTWFAHWFRGGGGPGFPYPLSGRAVENARKYSRDLWINNKWPLRKRDFQWVIDKFNPPGWETKPKEGEVDLFRVFYQHIIHGRGNLPKWRGVTCIKLPTDLILYAEVLWENKPDILIECGTSEGGSALFYADMFNNIGNGRVISIDMAAKKQPPHPRITYINGRMTAVDTLSQVKALIAPGDKVMVVLDGDHHRAQVKRELFYYGAMVTKGQYIVVEDIYQKSGLVQAPGQSGEAVDWYLRTNRGKEFERTKVDNQFLYCISKGGWLRKK